MCSFGRAHTKLTDTATRKFKTAYTVEHSPYNGFIPAAVAGVSAALATAGSPGILACP